MLAGDVSAATTGEIRLAISADTHTHTHTTVASGWHLGRARVRYDTWPEVRLLHPTAPRRVAPLSSDLFFLFVFPLRGRLRRQSVRGGGGKMGRRGGEF